MLPYCHVACILHCYFLANIPNCQIGEECGWSRWAADVNERRDGIKGVEISFLIFCLQRLPDIAKQKWSKKTKKMREKTFTQRGRVKREKWCFQKMSGLLFPILHPNSKWLTTKTFIQKLARKQWGWNVLAEIGWRHMFGTPLPAFKTLVDKLGWLFFGRKNYPDKMWRRSMWVGGCWHMTYVCSFAVQTNPADQIGEILQEGNRYFDGMMLASLSAKKYTWHV